MRSLFAHNCTLIAQIVFIFSVLVKFAIKLHGFNHKEETSMKKRSALKAIATATIFALTGIAHAQQTVKIANIVELSGPGTTAGTLFKNGVELAVKEINGAGGILGKKIESYTVDTQTNPGVAKGLTQKILHGAFAELHAGDTDARSKASQAIAHFFLRKER